MGQAVQFVLSATDEYVAMGQDWHAPEPARAENLPAGHCEQAVAVVTDEFAQRPVRVEKSGGQSNARSKYFNGNKTEANARTLSVHDLQLRHPRTITSLTYPLDRHSTTLPE